MNLMSPTRTLPLFLALAVLSVAPSFGQTLQLKDGRTISGRLAVTAGVAESPDQPTSHAGEVPTRPIVMLDDELRRIYLPKLQVASPLDAPPEMAITIRPFQQPSRSAGRLASVGPALGIGPWDEFGRRIYEMQFNGGRLSIVQGITELTPRYAKVEALLGPERAITWDSRISTSSIPSDALAKILNKAVPQDDPEARLQIVRFYAQAKRFHEARDALAAIVEEFPQLKELEGEVARLRRSAAESLLTEVQLRRTAGQHRLVETLLENFPVDDVRGPTLERIRELSGQYRVERDRIAAIAAKLRETIAAITDPDARGTATPAAEEIVRELTHNNVDRLAPFVQLLNDASLSPDEKASLAISGWLMGANDADQNLPISISLLRVRDLVWRYLREPLAAERAKLLAAIQSEEAASVERVAKLVAHMKPPWHDPELIADEDGYLELAAPGQADESDVRYIVQLPPEYDPYRRYPTLVVLCGGYNSPEQELNFWAGTPPEPAAEGAPATRRGHAMRHGYITIAVEWQKPHQFEYEYAGREHIAVLSVLRDATRRFNIDADRVFLSGHDIGGEAAWDLGLAHPDLWAGVIPFVAVADKYIYHYGDNGRYVPMYFVAGELDGASVSENSAVWDIYLSKPPRDGLPGYDATVVEYQGRGHEPFHDEILNLFDWMGRRTRPGIPKSFQCTTLRPWDNFFWWLECGAFPEQFMIHPTEWTGRRPRPVTIEGKIQAKNRLWARTPAEVTTLWLSPEIVDFNEPIRITFNGSKLAQPEGGVRPEISVLLEDVRTRADRQRPFWAKLETR
jgi:hypothetical protein